MACHFTGIYDVNRNNILPDDDYSIVKNWADSIIKLHMKGIIFHNNFTDEIVSKYQNENISFIKVDYDPTFNPNVYRYFIYKNYFDANFENIEAFFLTDISDVELLSNPFITNDFIENPESIFCGDEPKPLENEWMLAHSEHLRNKIVDYTSFEEKNKQEVLLNCGIIGGKSKLMKEFLDKLCDIHQTYNYDNKTAYTGDMGAFNYLLRTQFKQRIAHGFPINTIFKEYQTHRIDCWFRHK